MDTLIQLDHSLFEFINGFCQNSVLDALMPYWRHKLFWVPLYTFLLFFLLINYQIKGLYLIIGIVFCISIGDVTSSQLIKKTVKRERPCRQASVKANTLIECGSGYSFPSSHATNHFAIAFFLCGTLGRRFRKIKLPLLFWAASIALGQVYVGVHFPVDVLVGAVLGSLIGGFIAWRFRVYIGKLIEVNEI